MRVVFVLMAALMMAAAPVEYGPPPADWRGTVQSLDGQIRSRMVDPQSAMIRWPFGFAQRTWKPILQDRLSGWFTCGVVNSKNRMGGYSGDAFVIAMFRAGQLIEFDIGENGEISEASVFCEQAIKRGLLPPAPIAAAQVLPDVAPGAPRLGAGFALAPDGLYIGSIVPGSAAETAHLTPGMVITAINDVPLKGVPLDVAVTMVRNTVGPMKLRIIGLGNIIVTKLP